MSEFRVRVVGLPCWLRWRRLLGPGRWTEEVRQDGVPRVLEARLPREAAADLSARLRGLWLDGAAVRVETSPRLDRRSIRRARSADARRRRDTTQGFVRRGARLDAEGRFSLTPEALAVRLGRWARAGRVVDAGCGAGGNAIGFARAGSHVTAIELDADRAAIARHNMLVYGVDDRVEVVQADAVQYGSQLDADLLFVDPPWGREWNHQRTVLDDFPLLRSLLRQRRARTEVWAKLPPSLVVPADTHVEPVAVFGAALGDWRRIKFLILRFRSRR
ncbi:MAG: methyltransferase domain-containing protein [Nannocystaceae bacterium]